MAGAPLVEVAITSPEPGACYSNAESCEADDECEGGFGRCINGRCAFTGGIFGGEAQPEPRDIMVDALLASPGGAPLSVTTLVDGVEFNTDLFLFPPGDDLAEASFLIPGFNVIDGEDRQIEIIVRLVDNPNVTGRDTVTVDIDRQVPTALPADLDALDALEACPAQPPELELMVNENRDVQPPVPQISVEESGCERIQVIVTEDTCGNVNRQEFITRRPPGPDAVTGGLVGYTCDVNGLCDIDPETGINFEDGARIGRGTVAIEIDAQNNCIDELEAVLLDAENPVEECPSLDELEPDENGNIDNPCPPLIPGEAIESPGTYLARLTVTTCGAEQLTDEVTFTIVDRPTPDAGGPYEVTQGETVQLDASGSRAPVEIGGVVVIAWDLNGDGFFDPRELGDDLNGNGRQDRFETDRGNDGFDPAFDRNGNGEIDLGEVFPVIDGQIPLVPLEMGEDGTFDIALRVIAGNGAVAVTNGTGALGDERPQPARVEVTDVSPDCQVGGPYEGFEGEPLEFDASATTVGHPSDPIIAYGWDFGDNFRPQRGDGLVNPTHIYREAGEYTVELTVEDIDSESTCQAQVIITDVAPIIEGLAAFNDDELIEGEAVSFTAGETRPGSVSDPITNFEWLFDTAQPGNPNVQQSGLALRSPTHVYADDGQYTVRLTVSDEDDTIFEEIEVQIADLRPFAIFDGPDETVECEPVTFDATGSAAGGEADPLEALEWDFGDDGPPEVQRNLDAEDAFVRTHTYDQSGEYTVRLTVTDEDGPVTVDRQILVTDTQPQADIVALFPGIDRVGTEGQPLEFDASGTVAGCDAIVGYRWDFGDGESETTEEPRVLHTFADNGSYEVRVTVRDEDGSSSSAVVIVEVQNEDPEIELVANEAVVEIGQQIDFTTVIDGNVPANDGPQIAVLVDDVLADLPPRVVVWDFGDGNEAAAPGTTHAYGAVGEYTISVLVEDQDGGMAEADIDIEVTAAAPRIGIVPEQVVTEGEELVVEIPVDAPVIGGLPAALQVSFPGQQLPGADPPQVDDNGGQSTVTLRWRPTYYQAGRYTFQVRAEAVGVPDSDRTRNVQIRVLEGGTPRLAAVGGTPGRGVVTVFDYGRDDFRAVAEIDVGLGAAGLAAQPDGRRLFVAAPGSNRVAVIKTSGQLLASPIRRIPVGAAPSAVVYGQDHMWVINSGDDSMSIIEVDTLKRVATVPLDGVDTPTDAAWLGADFEGLGGARIAVVSRRGGQVALVDPQAALAGRPAVVAIQRIGGALTRVVADPVSGWLHIADAKTRRVYRIAAGDVGDNGAVDGVSLGFAARDLAYQGELLYVATGDALLTVTDDGDLAPAAILLEAQALGLADNEILGGGALVVASPTRIENLSPGDLGRVRGAGTSRVRRLVTFVARE